MLILELAPYAKVGVALAFWPSMTWRSEGLRLRAPAKWRRLNGIVSTYWEAESQAGANGYYLFHEPRLMIFFQDVSPRIKISNLNGEFVQNYRSMPKALYIPAGYPLWTTTNTHHEFSHLNLHFHTDRLLKYLSPTIGQSMAMAAIRTPIEIEDGKDLETLAQLLVNEIKSPTKHLLYTENIIGSILAGLLDLSSEEIKPRSGRLTQAQLKKIAAHFDTSNHSKLSLAEMASIVGLSESWFSSVFKQTTGSTPLQWQSEKRIEIAKNMLTDGVKISDVASQLGFTDQAHFTKAFRQITGETPAMWRRLVLGK